MKPKDIRFFKDRGISLVWNDPDPIPETDYRIHKMTFLHGADLMEYDDMEIHIEYGEGSMATVPAHEIELGYTLVMGGGEEGDLEPREIMLLLEDGLIYPCKECSCFHTTHDNWEKVDLRLNIDKQERMELSIDQESVNIYIDNGEDEEPTHVVYWHLDEVEEDASVAISIANAINLYHTDRRKLMELPILPKS
jgi:hypothetical protein